MAFSSWPLPQTAMTVSQYQLTHQQEQKKTQLNLLQEKISALKQALITKKQQHNALTEQLEKTELAISQQRNQERKTAHLLQQQRKHQQTLQQQQQQLQKNLLQQRQQLLEQLQLAYLIDDPSFMRLLLDQASLKDNTRMMTYLRYIHHDQAQHLQELSQTIHKIQDNQKKQQASIESIKLTQAQQQTAYNILKQEKQKREQLLKQLNQEIDQKTTKLSILEADRKSLETLLQQLEKKRTTLPQAFAQLKGRLFLPTQGNIIEHFGAPIGNGQLALKGLFIAAPIGQNVHAIAAGKVIFANWLKGFGLLIIIDHGDGFMTLYARNQSLFKEIGEIVAPNEVIAEVGRSGGHEKSGLYFEIRHRGYPKNPESWCKTRTVV
jgi:murein hydrolase activator